MTPTLNRISLPALAALLLAALSWACSDAPGVDSPDMPLSNPDSTLTSYISLNIITTDAARASASRADDPADDHDFDQGTEAENHIDRVRVYFYLYKNWSSNSGYKLFRHGYEGGGFNTIYGGPLNFIDLNPEDLTVSELPNVGRNYHATIAYIPLLASYQPKFISVVVNPPADLPFANTDMETLAEFPTSGRDDKGNFTMFPSIYVNDDGYDEGEFIPVTGCIGSTAAEAAQNPVTIHVERVLARLDISFAGHDGAKAIEGPDGDIAWKVAPDIYAHLTGWGLASTPSASTLIKFTDNLLNYYSIYPDSKWNSAELQRCYLEEGPDFWIEDLKYNFPSYNDMTLNHNTTTVYPLPNMQSIYQPADYYYNWGHENTDEATKLVVTTQLRSAAGDPVPLYQDVNTGQKFASEEACINYLFNSDYLMECGVADLEVMNDKEELGYGREIAPSDFHLVACDYDPKDPTTSYSAVIQILPSVLLDLNGSNYTWNWVNEALRKEGPRFIVRKDGMAYYYTNVRHLYNTVGIVRNHLYRVYIDDLKGVGSPVFDPDQPIHPTPYTDPDTRVEASFRVLPWRHVTTDVTLTAP